MRQTRRQFLLGTKGLSVSMVLAGCLTTSRSGPKPTPTPTPTSGELGAATAPDCPEGIESIDPDWRVIGPGPLDGFELKLKRDTYHVGDELIAKLRNVTEEKRGAGAKSKFDLQYKGESGWHTILGFPKGDPVPYPAVLVLFPPGEGHSWHLTLSREGLAEGVQPAPDRVACQSIKPGTYRFVFWGIGGDDEAVGETFTVIGG